MSKTLRSLIIPGLLVLIVCSCNYGIYYRHPQPRYHRDRSKFPKKLLGTYYNDSSKVKLIVEKSRIIKVTELSIACSKAEIDTSTEGSLAGDSLYINDLHRAIHVDVRNDSVFGSLPMPDTLFSISESHKLRKLKGDYFLNLRSNDTSWQVIKLAIGKAQSLDFSIIDNNVDSLAINRIVKVQTIKNERDSTVGIIVNPSVSEFKKMVHSGLFKKHEVYVRL